MLSVKIREILSVSLVLLLHSLSCQPPSFDPMHYIAFAPDCSLPFSVHIQNEQSNCSGTIIHERWVLTAARCVFKDRGRTLVKDDGITLLAGIVDYSRARVATAQARQSQKIIVHNKYQSGVLSKFDFALIKVKTPFNFTECVNKTTISADPWPDHGDRSKNCISWGFGLIEKGAENSRLKIWKTVGTRTCPCANRFQTKRLICSAEAMGINLCRGDLGSSLVCYEGQNPFSILDKLGDSKDMAQKIELKRKNITDNQTKAVTGLTMYGVAHMTIDKYICDITRVPKRLCVSIPTYAAYMYLCPFNNWLLQHYITTYLQVTGLTMYGVAHMTIDKYICDITRVPKRLCVSIPTYAAYMYLCPFNNWLLQHVPDLPEKLSKCGVPLGVSLSRTLLAASLWVSVHVCI